MNETRPNGSDHARRVIDGLGDLFDTLSPTSPVEAEDELRDAGYDPTRVATAVADRVEAKLAAMSVSSRPGDSRGEHRSGRHALPGARSLDAGRSHRRRTRWQVLSAAAALLVISVVAWRAFEERQTSSSALRPLPPSGVRLPAREGDEFARLEEQTGSTNESAAVPGQQTDVETVAAEAGAGEPEGEAGTEPRSGDRVRPRSDASTTKASATLAPLPALAEGLEEGEIAVLNRDTWKVGAGRLPEEILARYRDGDWSHSIYQPRPQTRFQDPDFSAASKKNRGRFEIGSAGEIVERTTGKPPESIYGLPFPDIDPNDARAGAKVVWNYFYQRFNEGSGRQYLARQTVQDAEIDDDVRTTDDWRFYDGQPSTFLPKTNPDKLMSSNLLFIDRPSDLRGSSFLSRRYRDAERDDDLWVYVRPLRRVRRLLPAAHRSGSALEGVALDDGPFFDHKPEGFEWRLIGKGEMLAFFDQASLIDDTVRIRQSGDGSLQKTDSGRARIAYQVAANDSVPPKGWDRPLEDEFVLVVRPVWIVEGLNPNPYYPNGRIVLRIDEESYQGTYGTIYDRVGQLSESSLRVQETFFNVHGGWRRYASSSFAMQVGGQGGPRRVTFPDPERPSWQTRIQHPEDFFTLRNVTTIGR